MVCRDGTVRGGLSSIASVLLACEIGCDRDVVIAQVDGTEGGAVTMQDVATELENRG